MPGYCCVPLCNNKIGGYIFPNDLKLRKLWIKAIKRSLKVPTGKLLSMMLCATRILQENDYKPKLCAAIKRKQLKDGAIPTVFKFNKEVKKRKTKRSMLAEQNINIVEETENPILECEDGVADICGEIIVETIDELPMIDDTDYPETTCNFPTTNAASQCTIITCDKQQYISLETLKNNPTAIHYYTGFSNYQHFCFFLRCLGPAAFDLNYKPISLNPEEQLFITLMKLRQAKENKEIGILYNVSANVVSKIFYTWVNFMFYQLQELNTWPSKDVVMEHMPQSFRSSFPTTRIILDATEIEIEKPTNVNAQSSTFSTYKNKNTVKSMIGITPNGLVSFVSSAYGGSVSDRQIIENSSIYKNAAQLFESGDSIMADRGILVQDLYAQFDVHVNTPSNHAEGKASIGS